MSVKIRAEINNLSAREIYQLFLIKIGSLSRGWPIQKNTINVIDIDSPLSNSVQTIVQDDPDLILVPINTSQQSKALNNLPRTLEVIAKLESKAGYEPKGRIVSLGVQVDRIRNVVEKCKSKPSNYKIVEQMPELQEKMQVAIYEERKYIWEYEGCEFLYSYFCSVLEV